MEVVGAAGVEVVGAAVVVVLAEFPHPAAATMSRAANNTAARASA